MVSFKIKIANKVLEINALNELTKKYCQNFLSDEQPDYVITMSEKDIEEEADNAVDGKYYVNAEISALYRKIAELLIDDNIVVFHGSSFKVDDSGFIITARSGVGKSTHSRLLNEYLKDEFMYINDDKPLIEIKDDDIIVHSSPWNGKERRGNNISASLKAILLLNRGIENTYRKIENKSEIYFKVLSQMYLPREKSKRERGLKILDTLLKKINFYEINVNINIDSAIMTSERIIKNEIK